MRLRKKVTQQFSGRASIWTQRQFGSRQRADVEDRAGQAQERPSEEAGLDPELSLLAEEWDGREERVPGGKNPVWEVLSQNGL